MKSITALVLMIVMFVLPCYATDLKKMEENTIRVAGMYGVSVTANCTIKQAKLIIVRYESQNSIESFLGEGLIDLYMVYMVDYNMKDNYRIVVVAPEKTMSTTIGKLREMRKISEIDPNWERHNINNYVKFTDNKKIDRPLAHAPPAKPIGKKNKEPKEKAKEFRDPFTGMEFVLVRGLEFQMGKNYGAGGDGNEGPEHPVRVSDFYMGKYEVTRGEWEQVMGRNPSIDNLIARDPVDGVSWSDTQEFINRLNEKSGRKYRPQNDEAKWAKQEEAFLRLHQYRLPTEAEWEFAARSAHIIGLSNMLDGVGEWCGDWFNETAYVRSQYRESVVRNPSGHRDLYNRRVVRGTKSSATKRYSAPLDFRIKGVGFRLVLPVWD